jgi:hypothetical protein
MSAAVPFSVLSLLISMTFGALALVCVPYASLAQADTACSLGDPDHCASCSALGSSVAKIETGNALSQGKKVGEVLWTPLFMAYYMNCQNVGRTLVQRGASVNVGGHSGALLAEIASQRALNPDPDNAATNRIWAAIVQAGIVDVDAAAPGEPTNRQVWRMLQNGSRKTYLGIWADFEKRSIATTVAPDDLEVDPDFPTNDTGITEPAESPVSKGAETFSRVYRKNGMIGVQAEIVGCYKWAKQIAKQSGRRIAFESCAALDISGRNI